MRDGKVLINATLNFAADSNEAENAVVALRQDLKKIDDGALVGGVTATALDTNTTAQRDLVTIIPVVLAVILVILMLLLRSVLAPVLLVASVVLSYGAAMGVSAFVFNNVFGFPGADATVPLFGFVFLVALGVDYNIFLMSRVREESLKHGTRPGILRGLGVTGGVITSAGVVLAATFAALGVIPIMFLVQLAFIVAFGVLLDTVLVRSLLVPALAYDIGPRIWWPSKLGRPESGCRGPRACGRPGAGSRGGGNPRSRSSARPELAKPQPPSLSLVPPPGDRGGGCLRERGGRSPRAAWLAAESITNGRSNWYRVSASSRMSGENIPMARSAQPGTAATRGARAPAAAGERRRDLPLGQRGAGGRVPHPVPQRAVLSRPRSWPRPGPART